MLSSILKKESCAACRFCCAFRRQSLWEVPIFTKENKEAIEKNSSLDASVLIPVSDGLFGDAKGDFADSLSDYFRYELFDSYQTEDPEEEAPCPYLDSKTGCVLNEDEKPWDCKIWPLRVMRKEDGEIVVALTPTCPSVNQLDMETIKEFVNDEFKEKLLSYAKEHPFLVKEYREDFPIL